MNFLKRIILGVLLVGAALTVQRAAVPVAHAATFTVCKESCPFTTIQAAINAARSGDTINIGPGTYRENLLINKNLTFVGYGTDYTTLTVANQFTLAVINVDARDTITLRQLGITGGSAVGVFNRGTVNLEYVNVFSSGGGIINSGGTVQLTESQVRDNQGNHAGGGIQNRSNSTVNLNNTTVVGNASTNEPGGGIYNEGTLTVQGSTITANKATDGGGIFSSGGKAEVVDSSVSFNKPNNCVGVNGC